MRAEISYDLLMEDEMSFVEGTYRLPGGEWQVFIFIRNDTPEQSLQIQTSRWRTGASGVVVRFPLEARLNKAVVQEILSKALNVSEWCDVRGPDSMNLR
jgi:hypothetical protein